MTRFIIFCFALLMAYPAFAETGVRIVVPVRDIARGETVGESDLTYGTIATSSFMSGMVTAMNAIVGMQTRRVLHAGESMRADDVRHPILITKGATVTMVFEAPGVTLTAVGRAMSEGGVGDLVTVMNPASYRQISATVTGPGTVHAESSGATIASRVASASQ
jgi:flagella basal body P-ring formation protein FlgA